MENIKNEYKYVCSRKSLAKMEEVYYEESAIEWPQMSHRYNKPPIAFLVKMNVPKVKDPGEFSKDYSVQFEEYKQTVDRLNKQIEKEEGVCEKKQKELTTLEKELETMNKWANKLGKQAQVKRLTIEVSTLTESVKEKKNSLETVLERGETLEKLYYCHTRMKEIYEESKLLGIS